MDNDGALLEVLRNTYKGLRFRWKYRGLIILPAEQGNAAAADAIRAQYQKRGELFTNAPGGGNTLPELASLTVIPAVQGLAGQKTGYDTWFDALAAMEKQMDACDYEVAIIGAGAYGLPLAAHARDTGHVAIQMSGATQLLFGIKGRRWDTHPQISKLYNPAWVRPAPAEQPANKQAVEGGSYW